MLAVLILNIGLSILLKLGSFQQERMKELHTPDIISYFETGSQTKKIESAAEQFPQTKHWESEQALLLYEARVNQGEEEVSGNLMILDAHQQRQLSPFRTITPIESEDARTIYLPYTFQVGSGYNVGDPFAFMYDNQIHTYTIGGFIEDPLMGTTTIGAMKVFLTTEGFESLYAKVSAQARYQFLSVALTDPAKALELEKVLGEVISSSDSNAFFSVTTAEAGLEGNRIFVSLLAAILVIFAMVMVIISLIVIRFQIVTHIEDQMMNIGVLKANGYTTRQIVHAILLQFTAVTLIAVIPGLILSILVMPLVGNLISASIGLLWPSAFDGLSGLLSLLIVTGLVLLVSLLSSLRIRSITPVMALQNGLKAHNFQRNYAPLEKNRMPLQFALSLKSVLQQWKQNVMIVIVVAGLTFSSIFCSILNFNFNGDVTALTDLIGLERSSLLLTLKEKQKQPELFTEVAALDHVDKITILDTKVASVKEINLALQVSDDFSRMETKTIYQGRQPEHDNEIAISGIVAKKANLHIGDEAPVAVDGVTSTYLITGLSQQINQLGMVASMTTDGMKRLLPDYRPAMINVYLDGETTGEKFTQLLNEQYPGVWNITNIQELQKSNLGSFTSAVSSLTIVITVVTILVVSLILYLVIKTLIQKRKLEFGILKATGYTTLNLMTQITLSLLPVIGAGVLLGGLLGYFYTDQAFVLMLSSLGIYNAKLSVNLPQMLLLCILILGVAYMVSMLVTRRIRNISVYDLMSE